MSLAAAVFKPGGESAMAANVRLPYILAVCTIAVLGDVPLRTLAAEVDTPDA